MEAAQVSIDWRMDKDMVLSHKKEWNLATCSDIDGARKYNVKQNESVRERQIPYDFIHMLN